jgi:DNA adenine methylase
MGKPAGFSGYFASPLRYPGGKGRLGPWLASIVEANDLRGGWYVEPYAGGAGAALYLLLEDYVEHIVINDDDPLIHAFWHAVVHDSDAFVEMIRVTPVNMESRAHFQGIVANASKHSSLDLGFAAFFLNRTSRSGILAGGVIGGKEQAGTYKLDARYKHDELIARVLAIGAQRERITVVGMDALDMLVDTSPGFPEKTLIYLDPPYYVKGSLLYGNHYDHADHEAIAHYATLIQHPLLITYDNCPEIRALYRRMKSTEFCLQYSTHVARPVGSEVLIHANLRLPTPPQLTRAMRLPERGQSRQKATTATPAA